MSKGLGWLQKKILEVLPEMSNHNRVATIHDLTVKIFGDRYEKYPGWSFWGGGSFKTKEYHSHHNSVARAVVSLAHKGRVTNHGEPEPGYCGNSRQILVELVKESIIYL